MKPLKNGVFVWLYIGFDEIEMFPHERNKFR